MGPLVSVIVPTHNRATLLEKAVRSAMNQTVHNIEIIVVNDASTDETENVLRQMAQQDPRIKVITQSKPSGGSRSRNRGIFASQGEWIAFLDDDDEWSKEKLTLQLQALYQHENAVACSSAYIAHYPFRLKKTVFTPSHVPHDDLLKSNVLGGSSVCLCSSRLIKKIGGFDTALKSAQDWDLWLRLRACGDIISVPTPLVHYRVHFNYRISNNMQSKYAGSRRFYFKHRALMTWETRRINLKFICFIKSRQQHRPFFYRMKHLGLAMRHSSIKSSCAYLLSSGPRLVVDGIKTAAGVFS